MSTDLALQFDASGPVATPPAQLQAALITLVSALAPGYTANLPGSLIEDLSSTAVGALIAIDQARVDAVNNLTPYGANPYILQQLGQQFGVPLGLPSNASAFVLISGPAGYVIPPGFLVGDTLGNQYTVQDGGTIATSGNTAPLFVVCTNSNVFSIPPGSITQIITAVPSGYTLTVSNPSAGTPALGAESSESYRARLLSAFNISIAGTNAYLKTLLAAVPGVTPRLVSVLQSGGSWEVLCGGGDPYQVAGAIYQGVSHIGLLSGSQVSNTRNVTVSIYDAPDTYQVVYVNPPQQTVTIAATWNTRLPNFTAGASVDQYMVGAMQAYVNSILVGQPINLLVLTQQIQGAIAPVLDPINLTTLEYVVTINGNVVAPAAGTSIIASDPEGYFFMAPTGATATQG